MTTPPSTLASPQRPKPPVADAVPAPAGPMSLKAFLRKPALPERATGFGHEGLRGVLRLYGIDFVAMSVLAVLAVIALASGFDFPSNSLNDIALTPAFIAIIVLGAPLTEEIAFRSWLSGRPGHVAAGILCAVAVLVAPAAFYAHDASVSTGVAAFCGLLIVLALLALWLGRNLGPMRWFALGFPVIFWLVTLAFAAVHLTNYTEGTLLLLLPLVVPQFIAGALFGYARVQYGLWAAMLLHAMHNGTAVALVLVLGDVMPGAS